LERARQRRFPGGCPKEELPFRAPKRFAAGGAALYRRPSFASLVPACRFDSHAAIMAHPGTNRKPSIGFSARFFWRGWLAACDCKSMACDGNIPTKQEKRKKKCKIISVEPLFFSQKGRILSEGICKRLNSKRFRRTGFRI
jgi:hypothetical protein